MTKGKGRRVPKYVHQMRALGVVLAFMPIIASAFGITAGTLCFLAWTMLLAFWYANTLYSLRSQQVVEENIGYS